MLLIRDDAQRVLLVRRPPAGVWGGLWSFPECARADVRACARRTFGLEIAPRKPWPAIRHGFSHFDLVITPVPARLVGTSRGVMENHETVWYNVAHSLRRGVSAPVKTLLEQLRANRIWSNKHLERRPNGVQPGTAWRDTINLSEGAK
jgi:A/G-specific adenine glycosylase